MTYYFAIFFGLLAAAGGGGGSGSTTTPAMGFAGSDDDGADDGDVTVTPAAPEPTAPAPAAVVVPTPPASSDGGFNSGDSGSGGSIGSNMPNLPNSAYDIGWAGLSGEEQLIVELVNRARMDPRSEEIRLAEPLADGISRSPVEALAVVPTLSDAAEAHSEDMDNQDYFSHTGRDGDRPWDRAQEAGHENSYVGENIGWIGSSRTTFDEQARAEDHHHNLWDSDGHQANLMSGNWSEIGVGYDYGSYQGYNGSTFVTELFSDTGKSYLTGVVIEDEDGDEFYDIGEGQGDVRITAFNEDEAYATSTWDSGGYSLALPPGTYTVVFEGGDLDAPYETEVTIGADNVKLDVLDEGGTSVITLSAGPPPAPGDGLMATLAMGPADEAMPLEDMPEEEPELMML
ncbi:MAG: CAP domain-containing protein [Paracoccaceae bacterium]